MKVKLDKIILQGLAQRVPTFILGYPGVGKTAKIRSIANKKKWHLETLILALREPTDVFGYPTIHKDTVKVKQGNEIKELPFVVHAPPGFAIRLQEHDHSILFIDELTCATASVQAAALRVISEWAIDEFQLNPSKIGIIAAGNPPEIAAGGQDLTPPMANRFRHFWWPGQGEDSLREYALEWTEGFPGYWGDPPGLGFASIRISEKSWSLARSLMAGFIRANPGKLVMFPKEVSQQGAAWASARTFDFASRAVALMIEEQIPIVEARDSIVGCIGEGVGDECTTWLRNADLIDPEEALEDVIKNKSAKNFKLPVRGDLAFTLLTAITTSVVAKPTEKRWTACWDILEAAAFQGAKDAGYSSAKELGILFKKSGSGKLPYPTRQVQPYMTIFEMLGLISKST